jgi:hypothetical protein
MGAALRYAAGDRLCRPHTCGSNSRAWRRDHPGVLPTGHGIRPLAATRHKTPLVGLPRGADLMQRTPPRICGEEPLPAGGHSYIRAADHRWDTAQDGPPHAAHTASASPDPWGPPWALARVPCGRRPGPRRASDDTAHSTAPRASGALGHGGATAAGSPPRATSSAGERRIPHRPPRAARER